MTPKSILVVGGGTAGLITAIILKKRLNISVDVVHSKNIGIIGVGEGSTEHFREFIEFVGIDYKTIIKKCDATFKSGILFKGWGEKDYLHSVVGKFNSKIGQYSYVYADQISRNSNYLHPKSYLENKIDKTFIESSEMPFNQFHFNSYKLNDFLIEFAKNLNINIYEDDILDVKLNEKGFIDHLTGSKKSYNYDFYIDSTGFKRVLIDKLGAKWVSYSKWLKMKSAIVFPTDEEENYNLWTLAQAMDYGWMFRIPVWGRYGNGYIFDSDYISLEQANQEVNRYFNKEIQVSKQFNFDPGYLENVWIKNCCAIGLSGSFVEPLEASSIGTTIQQSFLLMHYLSNYDDKVVEKYNKSFSDIMNNIRDFIVLHYITDKKNTNFWKSISKIDPPDTLKEKLELWKNKIPIHEDFSNLSDYILFTADNFTMVLDGLNLFNRKKILEEFDLISNNLKLESQNIIDYYKKLDTNSNLIDHKKFIEIIRNDYFETKRNFISRLTKN